MSKKKSRPGPGPATGGKKQNPIATLLKEHTELTREEAQQIIDAGVTFEEWRVEQERKREERRRANHERILAMICTQHPDLSREQANEVVVRGISPEAFKEELRQKQKEARRQERSPQSRGFQKKPGKPMQGKPSRGFQRKGGKPKAKKWDKNKISKKKEQRKQVIDEVLIKYPELMDRAVAGQIASGHLTYEQWVISRTQPKQRRPRTGNRSPEEHATAQQLRQERMQRLQERVERESHLGNHGDAYLSACIESKSPLRILRFHRPHFVGTLIAIEPFRLFFQTDTNPNMVLTKRFCSSLLQEEDWDIVSQQLSISLPQRALRQMPHHEPHMRAPIPDELLIPDHTISVMLHEGLFFSGSVRWVDRFQFLLDLPQGGQIFVFRHGVHRIQEENPSSWQDNAILLPDFEIQNPSLPDVHPKELNVDELFIPVHFQDYPVEDPIFQKYRQSHEKGNFQFEPILVRRESDMYVLVDGYRRWYLAKELGISVIPITVVP